MLQLFYKDAFKLTVRFKTVKVCERVCVVIGSQKV